MPVVIRSQEKTRSVKPLTSLESWSSLAQLTSLTTYLSLSARSRRQRCASSASRLLAYPHWYFSTVMLLLSCSTPTLHSFSRSSEQSIVSFSSLRRRTYCLVSYPCAPTSPPSICMFSFSQRITGSTRSSRNSASCWECCPTSLKYLRQFSSESPRNSSSQMATFLLNCLTACCISLVASVSRLHRSTRSRCSELISLMRRSCWFQQVWNLSRKSARYQLYCRVCSLSYMLTAPSSRHNYQRAVTLLILSYSSNLRFIILWSLSVRKSSIMREFFSSGCASTSSRKKVRYFFCRSMQPGSVSDSNSPALSTNGSRTPGYTAYKLLRSLMKSSRLRLQVMLAGMTRTWNMGQLEEKKLRQMISWSTMLTFSCFEERAVRSKDLKHFSCQLKGFPNRIYPQYLIRGCLGFFEVEQPWPCFWGVGRWLCLFSFCWLQGLGACWQGGALGLAFQGVASMALLLPGTSQKFLLSKKDWSYLRLLYSLLLMPGLLSNISSNTFRAPPFWPEEDQAIFSCLGGVRCCSRLTALDSSCTSCWLLVWQEKKLCFLTSPLNSFMASCSLNLVTSSWTYSRDHPSMSTLPTSSSQYSQKSSNCSRRMLSLKYACFLSRELISSAICSLSVIINKAKDGRHHHNSLALKVFPFGAMHPKHPIPSSLRSGMPLQRYFSVFSALVQVFLPLRTTAPSFSASTLYRGAFSTSLSVDFTMSYLARSSPANPGTSPLKGFQPCFCPCWVFLPYSFFCLIYFLSQALPFLGRFSQCSSYATGSSSSYGTKNCLGDRSCFLGQSIFLADRSCCALG